MSKYKKSIYEEWKHQHIEEVNDDWFGRNTLIFFGILLILYSIGMFLFL